MVIIFVKLLGNFSKVSERLREVKKRRDKAEIETKERFKNFLNQKSLYVFLFL